MGQIKINKASTSRERALFDEHEREIIKFLAMRCPRTIDMFGGLPGWAIGYVGFGTLANRTILTRQTD